MTVRIERREGRIVVDIRTQDPNGKRIRKRCYAPDGVTSISGATRWAEMRQRALALEGDAPKAPPAPTLKEFSERWMREYAEANKNKPSTLAAKRVILERHLLPVLGASRLDAIGEAEIQRLKLHLHGLSDKTLSCILSVLHTELRTAVRWQVISKAPLITLPRLAQKEMEFYGFEVQEAIAAVRHLRGKRLLYRPDGEPASATTIASWMEAACRKAGLPPSRNVHALRHTFISHLAMRGVPPRQIQEWAGHSSLSMTQKYMHLSPTGLDYMIHLLEQPAPAAPRAGKEREG